MAISSSWAARCSASSFSAAARRCASTARLTSSKLTRANEFRSTSSKRVKTPPHADRSCPVVEATGDGSAVIARPIVDDASEARCVSEANAPPAPLGVGGGQILGHEHHLRRAADEPGLRRVGLGLDQREHSRAVGRSDGQQPLTRPDASVEGDVESERVQVEVQTSLLILDVDVHCVDTEERDPTWSTSLMCRNRRLLFYGNDGEREPRERPVGLPLEREGKVHQSALTLDLQSDRRTRL